jgi:hypothetical protein
MKMADYAKYDQIAGRLIRKDTIHNQLVRSVKLWMKIQKRLEVHSTDIFMPLYKIGEKIKVLRYLYKDAMDDNVSVLEYSFSRNGYSSSFKDIKSNDDDLGEMCTAAFHSLSAEEVCASDESFKIGHQFYVADEWRKRMHERSWQANEIVTNLVLKCVEEVKFDRGVYEMMIIIKVEDVDFYVHCDSVSGMTNYFNKKIIFVDYKKLNGSRTKTINI